MTPFIIGLGVLVLVLIFVMLRILKEYQRGVIFTLGRFTSVKGPGLIFVIPFVVAIWLSFHNWDYLTTPRFVGFRNYANMFTSDYFWLGRATGAEGNVLLRWVGITRRRSLRPRGQTWVTPRSGRSWGPRPDGERPGE